MNVEVLQIQNIFKKYRKLQYPIALILVLAAINFIIYYNYLLPNEQKLLDQEQTWRSTRDQFSMVLQQQKTKENLEQFQNLLLTKNEFAKQVVTHLSETAKRLNLDLPAVSYKPEQSDEKQLTKMNFSFEVSGRYEAIRRFIHAIETSSDFIIIEDLILAQISKDKSSIDLKLRLVTYLK